MSDRPTAQRWILHVDMDAFYAAIEILDRPELAERPVIVGGTPEGHGVVSTANYIARRYGIHSALPAARAVRLCPHGVFLPPRPERYREESRRVFGLFRAITPVVEPLSIDEAFLDITGCSPIVRGDEPAAVAIARELQERVRSETGGLTCSVGIAENKFLAKLASDLEKPNGLVLVPRGEAEEFLAPLSIGRLWGVGPKTAERLEREGWFRIGDLQRAGIERLEAVVGREHGAHLFALARGIDRRKVRPDREAKSVSSEVTFAEFIPARDEERLFDVLFALSHDVARRLRRSGLWGQTVVLKVRDAAFRTLTRTSRRDAPVQTVEDIFGAASTLYRERVELHRRVRLLGVGVTQLSTEALRQLELFTGERDRDRTRASDLARVEDAVRAKLGAGRITRARLLGRTRRGRPDEA